MEQGWWNLAELSVQITAGYFLFGIVEHFLRFAAFHKFGIIDECHLTGHPPGLLGQVCHQDDGHLVLQPGEDLLYLHGCHGVDGDAGRRAGH